MPKEKGSFEVEELDLSSSSDASKRLVQDLQSKSKTELQKPAQQFFQKNANDLTSLFANGDLKGLKSFLDRPSVDPLVKQSILQFYQNLSQYSQTAFQRYKGQALASETGKAYAENNIEAVKAGLQLFKRDEEKYEEVGLTESGFLKEARKSAMQNGREDFGKFLSTALEVGFTVTAVLSVALSIGAKSNDSESVATAAIMNQQFGLELLKLVQERIKDKEEDERLIALMDNLKKEGVGKNEMEPENPDFKKKVNRIKGILDIEVDTPLMNDLWSHMELGSVPVIKKGNEFSSKSTVTEGKRL